MLYHFLCVELEGFINTHNGHTNTSNGIIDFPPTPLLSLISFKQMTERPSFVLVGPGNLLATRGQWELTWGVERNSQFPVLTHKSFLSF